MPFRRATRPVRSGRRRPTSHPHAGWPGCLTEVVADAPGYFDLQSWGAKSGKPKQWVWRLISADGKTMAQAVHRSDTQEVAEDTIAWVRANASSCEVKVTRWTWYFVGPTGLRVATSVGLFDSRAEVEDALAWVRAKASSCEVKVAPQWPHRPVHPRQRRGRADPLPPPANPTPRGYTDGTTGRAT
jgi:uncharacterized protein YegP (UPF0339 family)